MEAEAHRSSQTEAARISASARDVVDVNRLPAATVPVASVVVHDSPRLSGEDTEHTRRLAESDEVLPPIVVHYPSMRVIDGAHRLAAAKLRGYQDVAVRFVAGDESDLFILAVRLNIAHGLPLSLAERKTAAQRIIAMRPRWSDRLIASASGLSATSVAALRSCPTDQERQFDTRVGKDGHVRPLNTAARKEMAARLLVADPRASLREIARKVGLSHETVRQFRRRFLDTAAEQATAVHASVTGAESPGSVPRPGPGPSGASAGHARGDSWQPLGALRSDPAFRSRESGRFLIRLMVLTQVLAEHNGQIPPHCRGRVAAASRVCAREWLAFADRLEALEQAAG